MAITNTTTAAREYLVNYISHGTSSGSSVGLFNGDPSAAGVEVTAQVRAAGRMQVAFGPVASLVARNILGLAFGPVTAGVTVTHFAVFDAYGTMLYSAALPGGPRILASGDRFSIDEGALQVSGA